MTKSLLILAGAALVCSASLQGAAIIYDGFLGGDGSLGGDTGGTGLTGNWSSGAITTTGSLSYGGLLTSGGRVTTNPGNQFDKGSISPGSTLTGANLMDNGASLWFSVLIAKNDFTTGDSRTYFGIGARDSDGFDRIGDQQGGGFTIAVDKIFSGGVGGVTAQAWNDGGIGSLVGATRGTTNYSVAHGATFLAVGKITWGAFGSVDDKFELFLPDTNMVMGSAISTIEADFDQDGATGAFDTISFSGGRPQNGVPEVDEIRFGASYADVTPVPEPSSVALLGLGGLALLRRRRK